MKISTKVKTFLIVTGVIYCLAGVAVIAMPGAAMATLAIIAGIGILATGISLLIASFAEKENLKSPGWTLATGILDIVVGILLLVNIGSAVIAITWVIGFWALFASVMRISASFSMSSLGFKNWWVPLVTGIIGLFFAFFIIFMPVVGAWAITFSIGFFFIIAGVGALVEVFYVKKTNI